MPAKHTDGRVGVLWFWWFWLVDAWGGARCGVFVGNSRESLMHQNLPARIKTHAES
jgi:hypothetical protein